MGGNIRAAELDSMAAARVAFYSGRLGRGRRPKRKFLGIGSTARHGFYFFFMQEPF
jgi:hypothetical protein